MRRQGLSSAIIVLLAVLAAGAGHASPPPLVITTLSTAPDRVSGGDVAVAIDVPAGVAPGNVRVTLNGADVTAAFRPADTGQGLVGLLTGLRDGDNVVRAATMSTNPSRTARLDIRNFPAHGPIFAGPQQSPWICETEASGLGPAQDEHCTVATRYDWFYRTTAGAFRPLPSLSPPFPDDLAQTTTLDGHTVDYIVRVESGTIDQSIYRIAIIDDPTAPISNPWSPGGRKPGPGWNGKLSYPFGGGCAAAYRSGRNAVTSALSHDPLSLGFAVAFGTRNTLGTGCNDVVSAETVMMVKERFIEQYGLPRFTIGSGGSGGAIQQHLIAHNYPGLLDALTPGISYPDIASVVPDVLDCGLLRRYFTAVADPARWPAERRAAVEGYAPTADGRTNCDGWANFANQWQNPVRGFDAVVPLEARYDPVANPTGARGTFWDGLVNVFGVDNQTGFARSAYDNVGIEYGLEALNAGQITADEFLDINAHVGGLDIDGNIVPRRSQGDLEAIAAAYRTGRVVTAGEHLTLPIIDTRDYRDQRADIHTKIRTFAFLDRLQRANGTTANQVNWLTASTAPPSPNLARMALLAHNEWLEGIRADTSSDSQAEKVIRNKPAWVRDACWDAAGVVHEEPFTLDPGSVCNTLFPVYGTVRIAAGAPVGGDILKCSLRAADARRYAVPFTSAQQKRLKAVFPKGVCDYSKPGVKQEPLADTWLDFSD
jgi:hypothetical protein